MKARWFFRQIDRWGGRCSRQNLVQWCSSYSRRMFHVSMNNKVACTVRTKRCYFKLLHGCMAWLVVWNMTFIFPYIGNVIIPTHELHDFSEGLVETTNQWLHGYCQMSRSASLHHLLQQPGRLESTTIALHQHWPYAMVMPSRNVAKLPHLVRLFSHQSLHLYSMISIY